MRNLSVLIAGFSLFSLIACKGKDKQSENKSENNIDAARNFIRAALDGKFDLARKFMLPDSVNINYMDVAERSFQNINQSIKDSYRASNIHIHEVNPLNDSTCIVIYSNSYKNDHDTLKVVQVNNQWVVDFKYLYLHNNDTTFNKTAVRDSLK